MIGLIIKVVVIALSVAMTETLVTSSMNFPKNQRSMKMSKKYNHMLDMAFEIETDEKVWYNIPKPAIMAAVLKRVADIVREDTDLGETFSHLHTYEAEGQDTYSQQMQDELEPIDKDDEVVRWMTEGTNPYMSPRSDCG